MELLYSKEPVVLASISCSVLSRCRKTQSHGIFSSYAQYQDTLHLTRSDASCANAHQINCYEVMDQLQFSQVFRLALEKLCGGQGCRVAAHLQLLSAKCFILRHNSVRNLKNSCFEEGSRRQKDITARLNLELHNVLSMKISSSG